MRLPSALMSAALVLGAAAAAHADEWNRSFPVHAAPVVHVRSNDARIQIMTWDRPEVAVRVVTSRWKIGRQVQVDASQNGDDVTVETHAPSFNFVFFDFTPRYVHVEVTVPRHSDLDLHSGDGSISIGAVEGHIHAETGDGGVIANGLHGDIRLHTHDGSIEAHELDGRVDASTGDGHVTVSGRFDALEVGSGDGRVDAEALPGSSLGPGWSLHTGDGSLTLRIPHDLKADLDAHTGDGGIHVDIPVEVSGFMKRTWMRGTINGGGPPLKLRSGDGSIRLTSI
jgi:hypothetical protein